MIFFDKKLTMIDLHKMIRKLGLKLVWSNRYNRIIGVPSNA